MTRTKKLLTAALVLWVLLSAGAVFVFFSHRVSTSVTKADRAAIASFMAESGLTRLPSGPTPYDRQIAFLGAVQAAVLEAVPGNEGVPLNMCREPVNLLRSRSGLCYDRSRLLEKIFRAYGFKVRHAALYSLKSEDSSVLAVLMKPGAASHAVTEVLTARGWILVDPNAPFISLDAKGFPVSLDHMAQDAESRQIIYSKTYAAAMNPFYQRPFTVVYGLYSRHGRFYPPFDRVPDIAWGEFWENF